MKSLFTGEAARKANIVYLENSKHEFQVRPDGKVWSVYGSPVSDLPSLNRKALICCSQWQPEFYNWAFNYERGEQAEGKS